MDGFRRLGVNTQPTSEQMITIKLTFAQRARYFGLTHAAIFKALKDSWGASEKMAEHWAIELSSRQLQGVSPSTAHRLVSEHNIFSHTFERENTYEVFARYERSYS